MSQDNYHKNTMKLQQLMQQVGIANVQELSKISGVSGWQLMRLQHGLLPKMQIETLLKLSDALQVPVSKLLTMFLPASISAGKIHPEEESIAYKSLKQEYERLQERLLSQKETLTQDFTESSLRVLESWLLQWPTAAAIARRNNKLAAARLLPIVKPVEQLLTKWGVEAIGIVGAQVSYEPQLHQLMEGTAEPGDLVKIRYIGYRKEDKLLHRAKVSPVNSSG